MLMTSRDLIRELILYGDHKDYCGISQAIHNRIFIPESKLRIAYPPCSCGWEDLSRKALDIIQPAPQS